LLRAHGNEAREARIVARHIGRNLQRPIPHDTISGPFTRNPQARRPIAVVRTVLLPTCRWSVGFESRCAAAVFSIQHIGFQ
jgi:hypothetical protein